MTVRKHLLLLGNPRFFISFFKSDYTDFIRRGNTVFVFVSHFAVKIDGGQRRAYFRSPSSEKILICLQCFNDSSADTPFLVFRQNENGNQIAFGCTAPISRDSAAAYDSFAVNGNIKMGVSRSFCHNLRRVAFYVVFDNLRRIVSAITYGKRCSDNLRNSNLVPASKSAK